MLCVTKSCKVLSACSAWPCSLENISLFRTKNVSFLQVLAAQIKTEPHYAVLVDVRDRLPPQMIYIPQNLLIRHHVRLSLDRSAFEQIVHPVMNDYFSEFDGISYVLRPWLRALYPED